MQKTRDYKRLRPSDATTYLCIGSAAIFVLAMTFGLFEGSETPRRFASNFLVSEPATP